MIGKFVSVLLFVSLTVNFLQATTDGQDWLYFIFGYLGNRDGTVLSSTFQETKFDQVANGMDEQQVITLLGEPLRRADYCEPLKAPAQDYRSCSDSANRLELPQSLCCVNRTLLSYSLQSDPHAHFKVRTVVLLNGRVVSKVREYYLE